MIILDGATIGLQLNCLLFDCNAFFFFLLISVMILMYSHIDNETQWRNKWEKKEMKYQRNFAVVNYYYYYYYSCQTTSGFMYFMHFSLIEKNEYDHRVIQL